MPTTATAKPADAAVVTISSRAWFECCSAASTSAGTTTWASRYSVAGGAGDEPVTHLAGHARPTSALSPVISMMMLVVRSGIRTSRPSPTVLAGRVQLAGHVLVSVALDAKATYFVVRSAASAAETFWFVAAPPTPRQTPSTSPADGRRRIPASDRDVHEHDEPEDPEPPECRLQQLRLPHRGPRFRRSRGR